MTNEEVIRQDHPTFRERELLGVIDSLRSELSLAKQHNESWSRDYASLAKKLEEAESRGAKREG